MDDRSQAERLAPGLLGPMLEILLGFAWLGAAVFLFMEKAPLVFTLPWGSQTLHIEFSWVWRPVICGIGGGLCLVSAFAKARIRRRDEILLKAVSNPWDLTEQEKRYVMNLHRELYGNEETPTLKELIGDDMSHLDEGEIEFVLREHAKKRGDS